MPGKLIIISAPSGSGKTTLVKYLRAHVANLHFSISCTTRAPREGEQQGKDYYFLSVADFQQKIDSNDFVEWEEVYEGRYYGTLKTEVEEIRAKGGNVIFDVDVLGGINLKKYYQEDALSIYIDVPDLDVLAERLAARGTEGEEELKLRMNKFREERKYREQFDCVIVNDSLEHAQKEIVESVSNFLNS